MLRKYLIIIYFDSTLGVLTVNDYSSYSSEIPHSVSECTVSLSGLCRNPIERFHSRGQQLCKLEENKVFA